MHNQPQTLPCPNCGEIINDAMETCRFCSAPVDKQAAYAAAQVQGKVNQACSDASYLKTAALLMWLFLGLSFIPIIPLVGWGFLIVFVAVMVLAVRWFIKFGSIKTADADYPKARSTWIVALVLWLAAVPVGFVIKPILFAILFAA